MLNLPLSDSWDLPSSAVCQSKCSLVCCLLFWAAWDFGLFRMPIKWDLTSAADETYSSVVLAFSEELYHWEWVDKWFSCLYATVNNPRFSTGGCTLTFFFFTTLHKKLDQTADCLFYFFLYWHWLWICLTHISFCLALGVFSPSFQNWGAFCKEVSFWYLQLQKTRSVVFWSTY